MLEWWRKARPLRARFFFFLIMAPHSSTLAWKIPWMEEPGGLQSMGSLRVGHNWATSLSLFTFLHWRRKWQPTPVFLPGESQGRGAWLAAIYGVAQSRTWLKRLSNLLFIWLHWVLAAAHRIFNLHVACGKLCCCMCDLAPWPGMEPGTPALGAGSLSHWITREVPELSFYKEEDGGCHTP